MMRLLIFFGLIALWAKEMNFKEYFQVIEKHNFVEKEDPERRMTQIYADLGFRFPHIVQGQSYHESNMFRSLIFHECNNPFGFKHNKRGYSLGHCRGHAHYPNLKAAINDYLEYQHKYLPHFEKYVLRRTATEDKDYYAF